MISLGLVIGALGGVTLGYLVAALFHRQRERRTSRESDSTRATEGATHAR
jgi:hypothetical protein